MIRTAPKYNFKLLKVEVTEFDWVNALKICRKKNISVRGQLVCPWVFLAERESSVELIGQEGSIAHYHPHPAHLHSLRVKSPASLGETVSDCRRVLAV